MKCILHIGTEKTGTTLIQKWIYSNEENLSRQGVALTKTAGHPNNRMLAAMFQRNLDDYLRMIGVTDEAGRKASFETFRANFRDEVEALSKDHHTVVLTSEHMQSRLKTHEEVAELATFIGEFFTDAEVVCYFREQSQFRRSLYSTALKSGKAISFQKFHADPFKYRHYYDYEFIMDKWVTAFGAGSVSPVMFDRNKMRHGDIRKDFIERTMPDVDLGGLLYDVSSENESLSALQSVAVRLINERHPKFIKNQANSLRNRMVRSVIGAAHLKRGSVSDGRSEEIFNGFAESNRRFFGKYFNADENLFEPPPRDRSEESPKEEIGIVHDLTESLVNINGLTVITEKEVERLTELAVGLARGGGESREGALVLLKVLQRVRPKSSTIENAILEAENV